MIHRHDLRLQHKTAPIPNVSSAEKKFWFHWTSTESGNLVYANRGLEPAIVQPGRRSVLSSLHVHERLVREFMDRSTYDLSAKRDERDQNEAKVFCSG